MFSLRSLNVSRERSSRETLSDPMENISNSFTNNYATFLLLHLPFKRFFNTLLPDRPARPPRPVLYNKSPTYPHPSTWQEINAGNRVACTRKTQRLIIKESDSVPSRLVPLACRASACTLKILSCTP